MLRVQRFQALTRHMRVDRGGGNVSVAEQQLHGSQVSAVVQQVGRKSVPQGVR